VLGVALVVSLALVVAVGASSATSEPGSWRTPYSFMATSSDGSPVRWDPCSPIRYQVDLSGQPVSALQDIHEAVRRTAEASGLDFQFDGVVVGTSPLELLETVDFVTSPSNGLFRWSPVLITFAPSETFRALGAPPEAIGLGAPVTSRYDPDQYVSGLIVVNSDVPLAPGFEHAGSLGPVLQHELGHVLGLAHVLHPAQLMYPSPIVPEWNEGDIAGLRRLSSGPCLIVPSAFPNAATLM
jgi:Matrixin